MAAPGAISESASRLSAISVINSRMASFASHKESGKGPPPLGGEGIAANLVAVAVAN